MKQYIFGIIVVFLFFVGCSEKKENIDSNTWNKFSEIPSYISVKRSNKITSETNIEDNETPPADMPLVVSVSFHAGYQDAMNTAKPTARVSNQKDYLQGFREGSRDRELGVRKNLIVR